MTGAFGFEEEKQIRAGSKCSVEFRNIPADKAPFKFLVSERNDAGVDGPTKVVEIEEEDGPTQEEIQEEILARTKRIMRYYGLYL